MKLHDVKILTDENISPKVTAFLRQYGLDILDTKEQQWYGKDDEDLLSIAYQEQRFVLTHDLVSYLIFRQKPFQKMPGPLDTGCPLR